MIKNRSKLFYAFLLVAMSCTDKVPTSEQLTLLVTSNVRGQLDPCGWKANPLGGLPRRLTYINQLKDSGVDPILLDAGDALFEFNFLVDGKEASSKLRAKTVFESTAKMGNYLYNVGQNDFAAGVDFIRELENSANNNFISSNLVNVGTEDLAFKDHTIVERNGVKLGIFGIITNLPASIKELEVKDPLTVINSKVKELRPQVDVLIMLINANKIELDKLVGETQNVDYVFSSKETGRTRPERKQADGSPMLYGTGIQGKYLGRIDLKLVDKNKSINDITGSMMSAQLFEERLNNLQKRNPDKPLEDVYKNNTNVLNMVQKFRNGLKESKGSMDEYSNTSFYSLISLNGNVSSEKKLLKLVDQTLKTCDTLDKESASLP